MNNEMLGVIQNILFIHGAEVFENMYRANAVLLDMAPDMPRERILVRSLVEADGFRLLRAAGETYPVVISRLIQSLTDVFCIEREAAAWVTCMCASALGYEAGFIPESFSKEIDTVALSGGSFVAVGMAHMAAAASDGTVFSHGLNDHFQTDVSGWRRIVSVAAGVSHTVGLKTDGTVLATGLNIHDQCDVGSWSGVSAVYAFGHETVGVRSDGTALAAGRSGFNLSHFENIKSIAKAPIGVYGINGDGKVLFSDLKPDDDTMGEMAWLNSLPGVVDVISRARECVALCKDGQIYKFGEAPGYFSQWRDVVSIVDLNDCFAVLRGDGTVRVLHFDRRKPRAATPSDAWSNVAAVNGNYGRLIAQTAAGRLNAVYTGTARTKSFGAFEFLQDWYPITSGAYMANE